LVPEGTGPGGGFLAWVLARVYLCATLAYLLIVVALWAAGIHAIESSVTPFYAEYSPASGTPFVPLVVLLLGCAAIALVPRYVPETASVRLPLLSCWVAGALAVVLFTAAKPRVHAWSLGLSREWTALRWHLLAFFLFAAFFGALLYTLRRVSWFDREPSRRFVAWFLVGATAFAFLFPGAVAMIRDGAHGIAQAYERSCCEYIHDIGVTPTIRDLFHDYTRIHSRLSVHAKVHPPGPIALLWVLSFLVGRDPLPLSLATMFFGALGVWPLYLWAAEVTNRRVALTCCVLYSLMPSIVLFTATSADILFMPFTLTTLFLFWRALHRPSAAYALGAGAGFAVMSLLSFSLLTVGAWFAFVSVWRFMDAKFRWPAVQTASLMFHAFVLVHVAVWWWSSFDVGACFHMSLAQFNHDQVRIDLHSPRYSSLFWRFTNPACWFFFAGVPVSALFLWRIAGLRFRDPAWTARARAPFAICALTCVVLSLTYLARGEGERSAMYVLPFMVLPGAHLLDQVGGAARSLAPLAVTAVFLALQCWAIESVLYTFW